MQFEEFAPCLAWWKKRKESGQAWKLAAKDVLKYDEKGNLISVNLDIKNPKAKQDLEHLPPDQLADSILKKEERIAELMGEIKIVRIPGQVVHQFQSKLSTDSGGSCPGIPTGCCPLF